MAFKSGSEMDAVNGKPALAVKTVVVIGGSSGIGLASYGDQAVPASASLGVSHREAAWKTS